MKTPISSLLHFNHFILIYEDERGVRSYRLIDDKAATIAIYEETEKEGKRVPADLAAAMKLAKRRHFAAVADQALADLDAAEASTD